MVRILKRVRLTRTTPIYNIGAASKLCGLPIWTLRWIEKHELVEPQRTDGNQRLFSEQDMELLYMIRELMEKKVNLAGIRVIIKMRIEYGESGSLELPAESKPRKRAPRT